MDRKHSVWLVVALALGACSAQTREDSKEAAGSATEDIREGTQRAGDRMGKRIENLGDRMQGQEPSNEPHVGD